MGTSVATELMARDLDGELEMEVIGALLLNGSLVHGAARPALRPGLPRRLPAPPAPPLAQRQLRSPLAPLVSRLSGERFFHRQFGQIFSPRHPLTEDEAEDQGAVIGAGGGGTLRPKTIRYMEERFRHAGRWHGALRNWPKPLSLAWGMLDPVATERVLDAVLELRPRAPVTRLEG